MTPQWVRDVPLWGSRGSPWVRVVSPRVRVVPPWGTRVGAVIDAGRARFCCRATF